MTQTMENVETVADAKKAAIKSTTLSRRRVKDLDRELRKRKDKGENVEYQEWVYEEPDRLIPAKEAREIFVALRKDFAELVRDSIERFRISKAKIAQPRADARVYRMEREASTKAKAGRAFVPVTPELKKIMFEEELDAIIAEEMKIRVSAIRRDLIAASARYAEVSKSNMFKQTFDQFTSLSMKVAEYEKFLVYCAMRELVDDGVWTAAQSDEVIKYIASKRATIREVQTLLRSTTTASSRTEQTQALIKFLREHYSEADASKGESALEQPKGVAMMQPAKAKGRKRKGGFRKRK